MKYTATGTIHGTEVAVTWQGGVLTGNGWAIRLLLIEEMTADGKLIGPVGQQTSTKHLRDPLSAKILIDRVLTDAVFTGEVPEADDAPPGAVI